MMWINILLVFALSGEFPVSYWDLVRALNSNGCQVINDVYVSCEGVNPPPGAIPIPDDAHYNVPQEGKKR